ncbi:hypothetical protein BDV95DRAFT_556580 [Massariosphaeria phaeospora]|uniref:peptidylprolyl isomerase n=1 Tax=Massariosphaeria phaeospora TaxID=100035 RepID=A0A7C8MDS9_9PLEO|nr:hypothetical protein BDV95DRAFT_556580 [Massariosphaeria phaeospora]
MAGMLPAAVYGLKVPAGVGPIPAAMDFPATFRITMAALDPSATPQLDENQKVPRATLKLVRERMDGFDDGDLDDDDIDQDDIEAIKARLAGVISDEDSDLSDDDDESEAETNGGPSDPAKSKKAKEEALTKKLKEELEAEAMDIVNTNGVNGKSKGKAKALNGELSSDDDDNDDDDDSEDDDDDEVEELVICTLDPEKNYQQTLDITVGEHEAVYFSCTGSHDIYITGNYIIPPDVSDDEDEDDEDDWNSDEMDYNMPPDGEEELDDVSDSEEDALDGLPDPRVTEVGSDEDEAPKLVKKGKNKRPADSSEDEGNTLDKLISKAIKPEAPTTNGEQKLNKKQAKKLKKNDGQAVAAAQEPVKESSQKDKPETPGSDKKKVQFAKNLELGPTASPKVEEEKKQEPKERIVQGVAIEDKKVGKGRPAKKGDKIEMRYIGKLTKNGKQFDSNKKGKPFSFKLGVGEVIKGWDVGVVGMTAGGERRLRIPASLAYGKKALPEIPANSELTFDIKCLSVG